MRLRGSNTEFSSAKATECTRVIIAWRSSAAKLAAAILFSIVVVSHASAEMMSLQTHDLVIEKLQMALSKARDHGDRSVDLKPVRTRLADLLADRARLYDSRGDSEGEAKSKSAHSTNLSLAKRDREQALELYQTVLADAPKSERGAILLQMGHLQLVLARETAAEKTFSQLIQEEGANSRRGKARGVLTEAYVGRAEIRFARGQFLTAKNDFAKASELENPGLRGPILHRIAWCDLNVGSRNQGIAVLTDILRHKNLLQSNSPNGPEYDSAFHEEVATDLATFLARGKVEGSEIKSLVELSPSSARIKILQHFASESERLGNQKAANVSWNALDRVAQEPSEKIETAVHSARMNFDLGRRAKALVKLQEALQLYEQMGPKNGCADPVACENYRREMRNMIVDWNKIEKRKPSEELLAADQAYLRVNPNDLEIDIWAANSARQLNHLNLSAQLFRTASLVSAGSPSKENNAILETSLLGQIEVSEQAASQHQPPDTREQAYKDYLSMSHSRAQALKVQYQMARLSYEKGPSQEASNNLSAFALSAQCQRLADREPLCWQAADLDLDVRASLKDDAGVEAAAMQYSRIYPKHRSDYSHIGLTAAIKTTQGLSADQASLRLAQIDLRGLNDQEKAKVLVRRIDLAEKSKNLTALRPAAAELLRLKSIASKDRDYAYSRLAWAAEMELDFKQAYSLSLKVKNPSLRPTENELRLALLAELAGLSPRRHQEAYLHLAHGTRDSVIVRSKLILASAWPEAGFLKYQSELNRYPDIAASTALTIYKKTRSAKFARAALQNRAVVNQEDGRILFRQSLWSDLSRINEQLVQSKISSSSDNATQRTIQRRLALIKELEKLSDGAIHSGDWIAQLVSLSTLSREDLRLSNDILALPVPRDLTGAERDNYVKLVAANASTYSKRHDAIERKLQAFWENDDAFNSMLNAYQSAQKADDRALLGRELMMVSRIAPEAKKQMIASAFDKQNAMSAQNENISQAWRAAAAAPFSYQELERLREAEQIHGRETMVAYLDARLTRLKSQGERRQ